jgi:hypothetical protein
MRKAAGQMRLVPVILALGAASLAAAAGIAWSRHAEPSRPAINARAAERARIPPSATVKEIMAGVIDPAADALWQSVGTVITAARTEEHAPSSAPEWQRLERQAIALGDGAKALLNVPHALDEQGWRDHAEALQKASQVALAATRARSAAALFESGEALVNACDGCHERYWKDPGATP